MCFRNDYRYTDGYDTFYSVNRLNLLFLIGRRVFRSEYRLFLSRSNILSREKRLSMLFGDGNRTHVRQHDIVRLQPLYHSGSKTSSGPDTILKVEHHYLIVRILTLDYNGTLGKAGPDLIPRQSSSFGSKVCFIISLSIHNFLWNAPHLLLYLNIFYLYIIYV